MTNNTERMRINSSGSVGIGANNPSQKLEVVGNTKIQSGTAGDTQSTITNMSGLFFDGGIAGASTSSLAYSSGGGGGAALSFRRDNSYGTYIDFSTNANTTATPAATTPSLLRPTAAPFSPTLPILQTT